MRTAYTFFLNFDMNYRYEKKFTKNTSPGRDFLKNSPFGGKGALKNVKTHLQNAPLAYQVCS
jgi:hypothetical protein